MDHGTHSREQLRQSYADAWRKHLAGAPLTPLDALLVDVIGAHPEYQAEVIEPRDAADGANPFLHLGLHTAVREQIAVDRPPGVRDLHARLAARFGDEHRGEHVLMDALAQVLWEAQRAGRVPDQSEYLELARKRLP